VKQTLEEELDRLSLTQALVDAEMATARVIDLTERLVDARRQIVNLRSELEHLRIEYTQYRVEQERARSSAAYRLASKIWAVRNALRL
jgi:predicted  nucleic acid-binding Zn-ribbon protein